MEQLPSETGKAFQAFLQYAHLGPQHRSHARVATQLKKQKRLIEGWSAQHHWVARAAAWDREQEEARQAAEQADIEATRQRHKKIAQLQSQTLESIIYSFAARIKQDLPNLPIQQHAKLALQAIALLAPVQERELALRAEDLTGDTVVAAETTAIAEREFTWGEGECTCGHRHSSHVRGDEQQALRCTAPECGCGAFQEAA